MPVKHPKGKVKNISYEEFFERIVYWVLITLVFLLPIAIFPWGDDTFSLPKATILRLVFLVATASWATLVILQNKLKLKRSPLDLPLLAFVIFFLASTMFSVNPITSLFADAYTRHENFFTWIIYVVLFIMVMQGLRNKKHVRHVLRIMVLTSGLVSVYGIAQQFGYEFLDLEQKGLLTLRYLAISTFGNPSYLGGYICLVFPLALALTVSEERLGKKVLWIILSFLATLSLIFTFSRGAWIGFIAGFLVFILILAKKSLKSANVRQQVKHVLVAFTILIILAIATSQLLPTTSGLVARRLKALVTLEKAGSGRFYIWNGALDLISQRPLCGWGPNTFKDVLSYDKQELLKAKLIDRPHNQILSIAYSGGALLLLVYLWFIIAFFLYGRNVLKQIEKQEEYVLTSGLMAGAAGYLIHEQFFFSLVGVTPIFWIMAGSVVVMGGYTREIKWKFKIFLSPFWQWLAITLVILLALILALISTNFLIANYFHSRGLLLENREKFAEAAFYHRRAIGLNPWENRYRFSYGQALESYSMVTNNPSLLKPAFPIYLAGLKQNPRDYDLEFALGKSYYTLSFLERSGDYSKAELFLSKAIELRPLVPEPYMWLGLAFLQEGDFSQGVKYLERSREIGTTEYGDVPVLFSLAQGYYKMGRRDKARELLKEVLELSPDYSPARELLNQLENE